MSLPSGAFARVYRAGTRSRSGPVVVIQIADRDGSPRVGVVAGRKVGHAVQRNRAKRRMREAVRLTDGLEAGTDYVVLALDDLMSTSFSDLCTHVDTAISSNRSRMRPRPDGAGGA